MTSSRIHQLDNIIANQIAAGEVVERPASVVKELIENSLDASATRIEVEIEKGGASLIRVKDNGRGIHPDDLTLALSRHATSKISTTEDLSAINSLGFRGEALASISSVSRLKLISRWHQSEQALEAEAAGRDMAVSVSPAGLNEGTVVEVRELFFNTPARRRFMRADKTEFRHLETVISRMALSHPQVSFLLKHNGKKVRHFLAAESRESEERRVGQILGKEFLAHCVYFSIDHSVENKDIKFRGWLGMPNYHRSMNDGQFVFVNGRPIKDPVVSHAIREAYAERLPPGRLAAYIIDIQLDPETVDVNVHPTKHEVRFQYQRMVHDLITRAISEVLEEGIEAIPFSSTPSKSDREFIDAQTKKPVSYGYAGTPSGNFEKQQNISDNAGVYSDLVKSGLINSQPTGLVVGSKYLLISDEEVLNLVSVDGFMSVKWPQLWLSQCDQSSLKSAPILFPQRTEINQNQADRLMNFSENFKKLGIDFLVEDSLQECKLLSLPTLFAGIGSEIICKALLESLCFDSLSDLVKNICCLLSKNEDVRNAFILHHQLNDPEFAHQWFKKNQIEFNDGWIKTFSVTELDNLFNSSREI